MCAVLKHLANEFSMFKPQELICHIMTESLVNNFKFRVINAKTPLYIVIGNVQISGNIYFQKGSYRIRQVCYLKS